ncbi:unnamed protein product [Kuraishia capsulata CBS 1993]|uniref:Telomere length regulation protein conserved domain-containing protein n=1 Tax=Kuraishia capsulata CBS 1993 TaxID=1382522 RepID=W6MJM9_9ASCO|nr:uncharacterized protein KUCA_T00002159001 [Kuraishia capsulata CBS 1993]CDK26188.1 unnamed protein product [Kuraishia capsulata CBS 1993]
MDLLKDQLTTLSDQPSIDVLSGVLAKLAEISNGELSDAQRLNMSNVVVVNIVDNGIASLLNTTTRNQLTELLTSRSGLSVLISRLRISNQSDSMLLNCTEIITEILEQENSISKVVGQKRSKLELNAIKAMITGSKLFSALSEVYVALRTKTLDKEDSLKFSRLEAISVQATYVGLISARILSQEPDSDLMELFVDLLHFTSGNQSGIDRLMDELLRSEVRYNEAMLVMIPKLTPRDRHLFNRCFLGYIIRRFGLEYSSKEPASLYTVVNLLLRAKIRDWEHTFEYIIKTYPQSLDMIKVIGLLVALEGKQGELFATLLGKWADTYFITSTTLSTQIALTQGLLTLLSYIPQEQISEMSSDASLLGGVTNHMESPSEKIRFIGMVLPDVVYSRSTKGSAIFNMDGYSTARDDFVKAMQPYLTEDDFKKQPLEWSQIEDRLVMKVGGQNLSLVTSSQPRELTIMTVPTEQELFDPEDSDDEDPTVSRKELPSTPIYLRELLSYLESDNYDKLDISLRLAPTLIRQKSKLGSEVSHYSESLLTALVGLRNNFSIENFTNMVMNAIVAVVVSDFANDSSIFLLKLLMSGDYSLQQRMMILSSLSISIRELRGYEDDIISYTKTEFPSKMLPQKTHGHFQNYGQIDRRRELSAPAPIEVLTDGIVTRMSSKLLSKDNSGISTVAKPKISSFYRSIGPKAFFPLTNIWYAIGGAGFQIGSYSAILTSHFLKTLVIILECAYPSCIEIPDMVRTLVDIYISVMKSYDGDMPTLESVVVGLSVILDGTDSATLSTVFAELATIREWLEVQFEHGLQDETLMAKLAKVIISLQETIDKLRDTYMLGEYSQ